MAHFTSWLQRQKAGCAVNGFMLYARIRRDSKYYTQGLEVPHDRASKPITFQVDALFPDADEVYPVRMGGNRYRLQDVDFFVVSAKGKLRLLGKGLAS